MRTQLLECAQERFDGAVLAHPDDVKSVIEVDVLFALGKAADQFNPMRWKMREVGVGFLLGFAVLVSVAASEQHGSVGFAAAFGVNDTEVHAGRWIRHCVPTTTKMGMY